MKKWTYSNYDDYLAAQLHKTAKPSVKAYLERKFDDKAARFQRFFQACGLSDHMPSDYGVRAICLGARMGEEVAALRNLGYANSVGVDLCPLSEFVIEGDFTNILFPDGSFDIVYSNSIDHAPDLSAFLSEANRVLKVGGVMLLHLCLRSTFSELECLYLESPDDVISLLPNCSVLVSRVPEYPEFADLQLGGANHELFLRKDS